MMTNTEKEALITLSKRINSLASLKNASFCIDKEKDEYIKQSIKPYMQWFTMVACDIEKVVELSSEKESFKKDELEKIIYSYL